MGFTGVKYTYRSDTADGSEIPNNHHLDVKNPS